MGEVISAKLNESTGPTALALPLGGVSAIDVKGEDFFDTEADAALFEALRENLGEDVERIEVEIDINDEVFPEVLAETLDEYMRDAGKAPSEE